MAAAREASPKSAAARLTGRHRRPQDRVDRLLGGADRLMTSPSPVA